jgi:hypothetical protein
MKRTTIERNGEPLVLDYNVSKIARKPGENVTKYRVTLNGKDNGSHHMVMFPDFLATPCPEGGDVIAHGEEQNKLRAEYFAWMEERALYEALHAAGFTPAEAPAMSDGLAATFKAAPPSAPEPAPEPEHGHGRTKSRKAKEE